MADEELQQEDEGAAPSRATDGASVVVLSSGTVASLGLSPEQRVGSAMRTAREAAGLSVREMGRQLKRKSHGPLSEYETGGKLPPEPVVRDYERVLNLKSGTLIQVLEMAWVDLHGDAFVKRRSELPSNVQRALERRLFPAADTNSAPAQEDKAGLATSIPSRDLGTSENDSRPASRQSGTLMARTLPALKKAIKKAAIYLTVTALAITFLTVLVVAMAQLVHPDNTAKPIPDRSDPTEGNCIPDNVPLSAVGIYFPPQRLVGLLELRTSRNCKAAWGRFTAAVPPDSIPDAAVEFVLHRGGQTTTTATYRDVLSGQVIESETLRNDNDCVWIEVRIAGRDDTSASFRTGCKETPARAWYWPLPFG